VIQPKSQQELRGPSACTPRGFTRAQGRRRSKDFQVLSQQTKKQTNKSGAHPAVGLYISRKCGFSVESKAFPPIIQRRFSVESKVFHPKSDFSCVKTLFSFGSRHCASVLPKQVPKLFTDLNLSFLYILILGTYSKFARENDFQAVGVCFPQPCSSAGRRFAASRSRLQTKKRINSFPQQKIRFSSL